jgi:sphinganine C4-monooxygenase
MNSTSYAFTPLASTVAFPFYHYDRAEVYPGISDRYMSILAPFITYWVASLFFQTIDSLNLPFFEQHRLHEPEEVKTKNRVTVRQVVVAVLFQQFVQTLLGIVWLEDDDPAYGPMRDHAEAVGWYHAVLAKAAVSVLGGAMGSEVMKGYGASAASWVYWWGVPIVQLFFAA